VVPSGGFLATFNGAPPSPQPWNGVDWDVFQISRGAEFHQSPMPMHAGHGSDCSAPPASHHIRTWPDSVFSCRDHIMTAINAPGYGSIFLSPPAMLDFSAGPSTLSFDVSTLATSNRDWIDVWITPWEDTLSYPLGDAQGVPGRAVHVLQESVQGFWRVNYLRNNNETELGLSGVPDSIVPSAAVRTRVEITVSRTSITVAYPQHGTRETFNMPDLGWTQGVVQIGHHSYNPDKDENIAGGGQPNTWHWDNVAMTRARPFYQRQATPKRSTSAGTLTFAGPAPAGALLRFGGICDVELRVGGGAWVAAARGRETNVNGAYPANYRHPIPAGTTRVDYRFRAGQGGCLLSNPTVVAL
jgi:hypothetical protein